MKYIVLFCLVLLALGFRHSHKSQYDLGYEAGLRAATQDVDAEKCSLQDSYYCFQLGGCSTNPEYCIPVCDC